MGKLQWDTCKLLLWCVTMLQAGSSAAAAAPPAAAVPSAAVEVHASSPGSSSSSSGATSHSLLNRALQASSAAVPGQAFHDWRRDLIARKFSNNGMVAVPGRSSSSSSAGEQPQWINIVGVREQLAAMHTARAVNTTNTAAVHRLTVAMRALREAATRRTAAAAAAAYAAAQAAAASAASAAATLEGGTALPPSQGENKERQQQSGSSSSGDSTSKSSGSLHPLAEEVELALMSYVTRSPGGGSQLQLNAKPWLMTGFDIPNALALAVEESTRHQVLYLMDQARELGFNTIRFWGFADGGMEGVGSASPTQAWQQQQQEAQQQQQQGGAPRVVLQPAPGILNATVLSSGLDWLVHVAGLRGLKLVLVLTNGATSANGGMKQYTDWVDPALTVTDFYTNDTVKSVFLDYVAALLSHASSISGVPLREDPVIAGWQLTEGATHPGHPSSEPLLGWLKHLGTYLKERAPHQMVLPGLDGTFGLSSPHHLQHNPFTQVFGSASRTPHTYSALCEGTDFWLHNQLPEIDVATAAVMPDKWLACDSNCKLEWAQGWIRSHLREAVRLQKPLLLTGVGALRPQSWRRQVLQLVKDEMAQAVKAGHPIAGAILSGVSHPSAADDSGWAIYSTAEAVNDSPAPLQDTTKQAVQEVAWRRFMNHGDYLYCLSEVLRGESDDNGRAVNAVAWVDGWQDVLNSVEAIGHLACDMPGSAYTGACRNAARPEPLASTGGKAGIEQKL